MAASTFYSFQQKKKKGGGGKKTLRRSRMNSFEKRSVRLNEGVGKVLSYTDNPIISPDCGAFCLSCEIAVSDFGVSWNLKADTKTDDGYRSLRL